MKFSAISTVFNEEESIENFLESIKKQTKMPDEFVIVDGGSEDNTVKIIKKFAKKHKWVKLIVKKGANIAEGRNIAIKKAKNEIIVAVDAGCRMDKDNFKHMTEPFKKDYDVVSGKWIATYDNKKQEAMARVLQPDLGKKFDEKRFLPSSRNIAFKKSCWKKVGGYPENLYTGEDTLFNLKLKEEGCKFYLAKKAKVYWKMRKGWKKFWKQFYLYGKGDKQAGNLFNFRLNGLLNLFMVLGFWAWLGFSMTIWIKWPLIWIAILGLFPLYLIYGGLRVAWKSKKISMFFHGLVAFAIKRIGYIFGVTFG